jgi:hypothetical protein
MDERLEQAVATLDDLIELVRAGGLWQSELFLDMAKLQLRLDLNGITDGEFSAFCDALENDGGASATAERKRAGQARPRRNGELRLMRRAWRRPEKLAPRSGRRGAGQ